MNVPIKLPPSPFSLPSSCRRRFCAQWGAGLLSASLAPGALAQKALRIPTAQFIEPATLAPFYPALLRLALQKAGGSLASSELQEVGEPAMVKERYRRMLAAGELDVFWSSSTPAREAEFLPVRFKLLKGVNEHRLLLVRRADLARFAKVATVQDLRAFKAGAGVHWSDTQILQSNGFQVVTSSRQPALFQMLAYGRFDFLALGMAEVDDALGAHPNLDLVIEPSLLLRYQQPIYFFVHRSKVELAERIQRGLQRAAADGSLERLFLDNPSLRQAWERINTDKRRLLTLQPL